MHPENLLDHLMVRFHHCFFPLILLVQLLHQFNKLLFDFRLNFKYLIFTLKLGTENQKCICSFLLVWLEKFSHKFQCDRCVYIAILEHNLPIFLLDVVKNHG